MKKLLPQFYSKATANGSGATDNLFTGKKHRLFLLSVLTFLLTAGFNQQGRAQTMYYLGSDGSLTNNAGDGIYKVNQDGTGLTRVCNGVSAPQDMALDIPNNRAFVTSFTPSGNTTATANGLYRIDLGTGTATKILATNDGFRVANLTYDPVNDWIYYTSNDGNGATTVANDGLYRIKPDGTSNTALATSISATPTFLGIDIPHNKVYIYESVVTAPKLMTYNLSGNSATLGGSFVMPRINGMDYDPINNWIYYTTDNGTTALTTDDALWKVHPDGTSATKIISSLTANPNIVTVERTRNIAFVWNSTAGDRRIVKVDVAAGTQSAFPISPAFGISNQVAAIVIPAASKVATLSGFTISSGTLSPAFASGTTTYTASVANSVTSITVTPTKTDNFASIKVNGTTVTSGSASGNLALNIGDNVINTVVTAEDGLTTKTYALTVNRPKAAQTITFGAIAAKTYGNADFAAGGSASSGLTVSYSSSNTAVATVSGSTIHIVGAGTSTITASQAGDASYLAATSVAQTLTVSQATQAITFGATATKTYGDADFAAGGSVNSNLTVSYASSNTAVATVSGSTIHIVGAGSANITASQAGDANRSAATSVVQALTVNKNAITVTAAANQTKVYGNADPASYTYAISTGTLKSGDAFTGALTRAAGSDVGTYAISAGTLSLGSNYTLTYVGANFTITKRPLELTPTVQTKAYGDNDPASYTYQFTSGTSLASTDGMTGLFVRATGETPGVYAFSLGTKHPVNVGTGADATSNYTLSFVSTNLTITKRLITLRPVPATKVYGNADPGFPYQFVVGSVAPGEGMTGTFGRAVGEDVGVYALTLGTKRPVNATTGVFTDQYYTISFIADNLTITKRTVNVSANAQSKTYGDADPTLTYAADALGFSDAFSGSLTRAVGQSIGSYAITQGTLALNATNYTLNFTGANLSIGKKTVNVTAAAKTKTYGDSDPALTYTADALTSGDSFTGAITRAAGESFGTYAISQGNLALNSNYTLNFTGANLTINKKAISVTAAAKTKTYGDNDPALTYTADALVSGESFTGAITRAAGESFGTYAITQGTLALSSNYTLNYTGANLSIGKRTIDIYSGSSDVQYGDPDGTIGYSYSGTPLAGDAFSGALGRQPGTALGTYATTLGTFQISNGSNYDLIFHSAPFNIVQREIKITGGSTFKIYGDADPAINYSIYSGTLLAGDQITGAVVRDPGETSGPYNVSVGTLAISNPNYKLTFLGGYFEIDRAPLTLTIDNKTKVATKPNPALTYSVSGYKNGDTQATAFTAAINLTTDATISSAAGTYNIYPIGGVYATNYDVTTTGGTLTVTPASSINTLASATLNGGGFDGGAFDPATDFYSVSVPNGSTSATLVVTVTDPLSSISIGYDPATATAVASGAPYTITFTGGNTQQVPVNVTAENGTVHSYYFNVTPIPSDSKLSNLVTDIGIIAPSFNPLVTSYTLDVPAETEFLTITPTTHDRAATARVSGGGEGGSTGAKTVAILEGGNPISINVRSADRTSSTPYFLYVKRPIRLASLTISAGTLFPAFDPNVTTYTAKVNSAIPSITVTPKGKQSYFQLLVNGDYVNYGDASAPVSINEDGSTTIAAKIIAGDGETSKTYTINVVHASSNADLAGISLSTGALDPVFDAATTTYNVYLPNATSAVSFTPTLADAGATMTVNADPTASGATISKSNVSVGLHNYYLAVTAGDGVTTKTYTLNIYRAPSSEPGLANISVSAGALSPAFNPTGDPNYSVTLPAGVESVDITPVLLDTTASLQARLNGHNLAIPNQHLITVPVNALYNTLVLTSTAQDGTTIAIYTITLERPTSTENTLSSLTSSIGTFTQPFSSAATAYDLVVPDDAININLTPVATSGFATIKVNGVPLAQGFSSQSLPVSAPVNNYPIIVTAESGANNTIGVRVIRASSTNPNLVNLTSSVGALSPAFDGGILSYSIGVGFSTGSIILTPTSTNPAATITVNGTTPSTAVMLTVGINIIPVVVTATNGATKTYTVTVNRTGASNVNVAALKLSTGPLTRIGSSNNYTASVASSASTVTILVSPTDANATATVDGQAVGNGVYSQPVSLIGASTVIPVEVIAQDGVTKRIIQITVNKTGSSNVAIKGIKISGGALTRIGTTDNYIAAVENLPGTVSVSVTTSDANAAIKVAGEVTASGVYSQPVALAVGANTIPVEITAEDGTTKRNITISVSRKGSSNVAIASLQINTGPLKRVGSTDNFTASVSNITTTVSLFAKTTDANATVKVNGLATPGGVYSAPITLEVGGPTVIPVEITAEDGETKRVLLITVSKSGSSNVAITGIKINTGTLTRIGTTDNFTASVGYTTGNVNVLVKTKDVNASIKINDETVASGVYSSAISINAGATTTVPVEITAEDGVTKRSISVAVTRAGAPLVAAVGDNKNHIDVVQKPEQTLDNAPEELVVKQAVSPNGDGVNDRLTIQGINAYPENTVRVMNRNGDVIYEAKGYDNYAKAFDGHSSKGTLQQAGTYFYSVEYKKGDELKRKTGYIVIKY